MNSKISSLQGVNKHNFHGNFAWRFVKKKILFHIYYEADEVIYTMRADARHNCGNLLDQTSVTFPTL